MLYFIIAVIGILLLLLIEFEAVATLPHPPRRGYAAFNVINARTNYIDGNVIGCSNSDSIVILYGGTISGA